MKRKNKILCGLGSLVLVGLGIYRILANKEPSKYSHEWIENLTDKEWETEREIIRQKYCDSNYDISERINFKSLLDLFDKIKSDKDWAGKTPQGPTYHREHGYNLYKP